MIKRIAIIVLLLVSQLSVVYANNAVEPLYKTNIPNAIWGFDISREQSIAVRFNSKDKATLVYIELWFMNNSYTLQGEVTVSLNENEIRQDGRSQPSEIILEEWTFNISSRGWNIEKEMLTSVLMPILEPHQHYWLVIRSDAPKYHSPIWNVAGAHGQDITNGYSGRLGLDDDEWQVGYSAIPSVHIYGDTIH